jgi:hypothetical protein
MSRARAFAYDAVAAIQRVLAATARVRLAPALRVRPVVALLLVRVGDALALATAGFLLLLPAVAAVASRRSSRCSSVRLLLQRCFLL